MNPPPRPPRLVPTLVLLAVLAVAAGTTTFVLMRDSDPFWLAPSALSRPPVLPVAWRVETDRADYPDDYIGWDEIADRVHVHDGDHVRVGVEDVTRTDPATGQVVWRTPVPVHDQVCMVTLGSARTVSLTYSVDPKRCHHLAVYDLDTGELVRDTELSPVDTGAPAVDALGDALYLGYPSHLTEQLAADVSATVTRTDPRTGRETWRREFPTCFTVEDVRATPNRLLAFVTCPSGNLGDSYWQLVSLDPRTGAQHWTSTVDATTYLPLLVWADPLVIGHLKVDHDCCYRQWFTRLDDRGAELFDLGRANDDRYASGISRHWFSRYDTDILTVTDSTMIVGAWPDGTSTVHDRQLVGIDISTGRQRWRTTLPMNGSPELVRTEGSDRLFVLEPVARKLYQLDPHTGATQLVGTLNDPLTGDDRASGDFQPMIIEDTLILTPRTLGYGLRAIAFGLPT